MQHHLRKAWHVLAVSALAGSAVLAPSQVDDVFYPSMPDSARMDELSQLRAVALLGDRQQLKAFMKADIEAFWPRYGERLVVVQGDGEDATPKAEFEREFNAAYTAANADAVLNAAHMRASMEQEFRQAQLANASGVAVMRAPETQNSGRFAIIAMPSSLCKTCAKLPPAKSMGEQCRPQHPDLSFYESRRRLFVVFHEQAHAMRHLLGVFSYIGEASRHKEEVVANVYADLRMLQLYGPAAELDIRRRLTHEPVAAGAGRHYIGQETQVSLLSWYAANTKSLPHMHPHLLLERAERLALPHLLTPEQLVSIAKFEAQGPFVALGSAGRLKLLQDGKPREQVRDAKSCKWNYPFAMQQVDASAQLLRQQNDGATARYYQKNPYRVAGLQGVGAFGYNPQDEAQTKALLDFNNRVKGPMCEAFTAEDISPRLMAPSGGRASKPEAMCPQ